MPAFSHRALQAFTTLCRFLTGAAFFTLMVAVMVQVLGRSVFNASPVWTEELSRFALLFLTAFGAGLAFRSGDLVNVDLISEALPGRWPWRMRLFGALATAGLCAALIAPAWRYTMVGARQTSPALGWRMDYIHVAVLILLAGLMVFALLRAVSMLLRRSDGHPETMAEEGA